MQKRMKALTSVAKIENRSKGSPKFLVGRKKQREPCGDNEGQAGYYMD